MAKSGVIQKVKERQKKVLKKIYCASNCACMKTLCLNSEIYNKLNEAVASKGKDAQRKQRAFQAIIPLMQKRSI